MLLNLRIRDFAIIDAVELELPAGFTVVTGETGAGKSILVDALTIALGGRASADVVRSGADTAEVEAMFAIGEHPIIRARLEARDLVGDDPDVLLIRRVVGARGKGKVVINGRLSTLATLGELVRGLVDISGQHEQQSLLIVENHLEVLDAFAQADPLKSRYLEAFETLREQVREHARLRTCEAENARRADFLRFQIDEIGRVSPQAGEEQALCTERDVLTHAEKLRHGAAAAEALLYGDDGSAFDRTGKALAELEALARIDGDLGEACTQLTEARGQLQEVARFLQRYGDRIEVDPARLDEVETRLHDLQRLCRKHGGTVEGVLARQAELVAELDTLGNTDVRLHALERSIAAGEEAVVRLARELSAARAAAAARLDEVVQGELADMDLRGAVFLTRILPRREAADGVKVGDMALTAQGIDDVEFLWNANPGEVPRALARIASGGELSRLMLAVKGVLCNRDLVSVYVFDEVDAGLGGRAADAIGRKIQAVSQGHQAITITHLAPIAARADFHLRVSKEARADRTVSMLEPVKGSARAEEIARMIDGASITKATRQAAKAMLARCT